MAEQTSNAQLNHHINPAEVALIEALLLASGEPISIEDLVRLSKLEQLDVRQVLEELTQRYQEERCGFELLHVAGKYQLRTKLLFAPYVRELRAEAPRKLSAAALETLAVIAYRQPVVRSDIERIRGVDVTPTLKTLLERRFVKILGHQASVGQPALYGTTEEFLEVFGLASLADLPALRELQELERDPGETEGAQPEQRDSEGPTLQPLEN